MAKKAKSRTSAASETASVDYGQRTERIKAWATVISALGGLGGLGGLAVYSGVFTPDSPADQGPNALGNQAVAPAPRRGGSATDAGGAGQAPPSPGVIGIPTATGRLELPAGGSVRVEEKAGGSRTIFYCPPGQVMDGDSCHPPASEPPPPDDPYEVPPPPPPPAYLPPEETPPPSPTPPSVAMGPYVVFFDWDEDEITANAAAVLDGAAATHQQFGNFHVTITGHTDRSGPAAYNVGLSQRRAANVRSYLLGLGVPDATISTEALGESRPAVDSGDGVREPQNRRVEITFGPAPTP